MEESQVGEMGSGTSLGPSRMLWKCQGGLRDSISWSSTLFPHTTWHALPAFSHSPISVSTSPHYHIPARAQPPNPCPDLRPGPPLQAQTLLAALGQLGPMGPFTDDQP